MKIVTVEQMVSIEKKANADGISYDTMMQNAGMGIANWVYKNFTINHSVIGLIGSGNNGGDTLIALAELNKRGIRTTAFLVKSRQNDDLVKHYVDIGGQVVDISENQNLEYLKAALIPGASVLDGILGTGTRLPIRGILADVMTEVSRILKNSPGTIKIAVDCPSGVDCDTGEVSQVTCQVDFTLCMAAIKQGLLKHPARSCAGDLQQISIGIEQYSEETNVGLPVMLTNSFVRSSLPVRPDNAHKGTFGTCLVVAGSAPYVGAAFLTGKAAYRSGCGLVNTACLPTIYDGLAGIFPETIWTILPDVDDSYELGGIPILQNSFLKADALVVGPGWGLSEENYVFLKDLLTAIPKNLPTVFDADGMKLLKQIDTWWNLVPKQTVLTPHPGEMALLTGLKISEIQKNRWEVAAEFAKKWHVTVILKGAVTVIAVPDGQIFINPSSNAALATAGSGDVLAGVIGGLLAQGSQVHLASICGVYLHALAGIGVSHELQNNVSVTAVDILDYVGSAISEIKKTGL